MKVRDDVFLRDRIQTAEQSVIRVLMGGRITITIRERSIVTITDDPTRPRVDLESGRLAFKVHQGGLRPGEVGEIFTPNTVAAIRGSLVIAEVNGSDSDVTVLEAHKQITIAPRDNPSQTTILPIGHTVRVSGPRHAARLGLVRRAAREHLQRAAEFAEVPGRRRDGGEERGFDRLRQPETSRPVMEPRASAPRGLRPEERATTLERPERPTVQRPERATAPRPERATAERPDRAERPAATRRPGPQR